MSGDANMMSNMALTQSASSMLNGMVDTSNPLLAFMWNFVVITLIGAIASAVRDGDITNKIRRFFSREPDMGFSLRFRAKDPQSYWSHRIMSSNEFKAWLGKIREVVQQQSKEAAAGAGEGLKYLQEFLNSDYYSEDDESNESRFMPDQAEAFRLDDHIFIKFEENRQTDNNKTVINYDLHVFVREVKQKRHLLEMHQRVMDEYYEAARTRLKKPHIFVLGGDGEEEEGSVSWKMYPFSSTRKMEHVWFKQRDEFLTAYNNFADGREAYERRGDPWTFSALLFGHPGCGKTSLLKAIANEAKRAGTVRHMFVIDMNKIESAAMLTRVIFDQDVNGYRVPLHQRMLVFEDFDANDGAKVFKKRTNLGTSEREQKASQQGEMMAQMMMAQQAMMLNASTQQAAAAKKASEADSGDGSGGQADAGDGSDRPPKKKTGGEGGVLDLSGLGSAFGSKKPKVSLSEILNILDGINERTGSIAFWTTNVMNPRSHFDPAFLRPGRMDLIIEFTPCDADGVAFLVRRFFDLPDDELTAEHVLKAGIDEDVFTPAQVKQVCKESTDAHDALLALQHQCAKVAPPALTRMWSQGPLPLTDGVAEVEDEAAVGVGATAAAAPVAAPVSAPVTAAATAPKIQSTVPTVAVAVTTATTSGSAGSDTEEIEDDMPIDYD